MNKIFPAENKISRLAGLISGICTAIVHKRTPAGIRTEVSKDKLRRNLESIGRRLLGLPFYNTFPLSESAHRELKKVQNKPHVLHVICNMEIGGSQKIILDLFEHSSAEFRMNILTGRVPFNVSYPGLPVTVVNERAQLASYLRTERPELVHFHFWGLDDWMEAFLETAFSLKEEIGYRVIQNANNPIEAFHHPEVDYYVFVSEYAKSIQKADTHKDKSCVIYPGVDGSEFNYVATRKDRNSVGLVYRLTNDKIARDTIDLLVLLAQRNPNLIVHVIGDGPNLNHYIRTASRKKVRNQICFHGNIPYDQLSSIYESFNVYLAPVHHESYGVVVPYALFKGNPIVAYDVEAIPELVGVESRVPTGDVEGFLKKVDEFTRINDYSERFGEANREKAQRKFSLKAMLANYQDVYRKLLTDLQND